MKEYILITGCGRSGTKWLATLLQLCCPPNTEVYHELSAHAPNTFPKIDFSCLRRRVSGEIQNTDYWEEKFSLMEKQLTSDIIIEVSSFGQYFLFGYDVPFKVFHLIRHGLKVVRSCLPRGIFRDKSATHPTPELYGVDLQGWNTMPRFQKLCWWWRMVNEVVGEVAEKTYRLEDLVSNYYVANQMVYDILGIGLDKRLWHSMYNRRVNRAKYRLPEISDEQKEIFKSICGMMMIKYYPETGELI